MVFRRLLLGICFCLVIITAAVADQTTASPSVTQSTVSNTTQTRRSFLHWLASFFHRKEDKNRWDLLVFGQAFPVPFCALKHDTWCKTYLNESQWIVRGIWPTRKNGDRVTDCSKTQFDTAPLKDLLPQMKQHWTSILHPDEEFWSRQWVKHGSCSLDLFRNETEYFQQGLKWNEQWPLGQILRSKNVLPSNEKVYKYKQFYDNIRDVIGRTPHLRCHSYKNMSFIKEVRLCVSKKLKLIDCHKYYKQKTDCPQEGLIYPRTPDFYKKMYVYTTKIGQQLDRAAANTTTDAVKGLEE